MLKELLQKKNGIVSAIMKNEKKQIIKKILVHENIKDQFQVPFTLEAPVIFCSNITSRIDSILIDCEGYTLLTLIIIPVEQYSEIDKFLNLTDYSRIFYQMILIGSEEDLINQNIDRLYHIADFLTEKTGEYKMGFVIKKAFSIIEKHFQNKDYSKKLFKELVNQIEKNIGGVKIESLPCCIHLVSGYTFSGVWLLKDRVRLDFRVPYNIESKRIINKEELSINRKLYYLEIVEEKDIDDELLGWIRDSYFLQN